MTHVDESAGKIFLKPGEIYFSEQPSIVSTVLGSCVSVTMFSPERHIGAICHAVLPEEREAGEAFRYVDSSILTMLEGFDRYGIPRSHIEVKLFGGAEMLPPGPVRRKDSSVGRQNIEIAMQVVERENLQLVASDLGGVHGRKIFFNTHTGEILLKRLRKARRGI
jgi:chemotaxis protein CheD